jgi:hypothetical protein
MQMLTNLYKVKHSLVKSCRTRYAPWLVKLLLQVHFNPIIKQRLRGIACFILAAAMMSPMAGCVDLTGLPADPLAAHGALRAAASDRYPGHVYCMRGFLGIFSTGMDTFARTLNRRHIIRAAALADEARMQFEHRLLSAEKRRMLHGPLILVGHSYGADDQIRVARYLGHHGYKVMLLLLLDPVTPPRIPINVRQCFVIYKSHPLTDWLPFLRGVPVNAVNPRITHVTNLNVRDMPVPFHQAGIDHINISANPGVQSLMLSVVSRALHRWELRHNFPVKPATLIHNPRFP